MPQQPNQTLPGWDMIRQATASPYNSLYYWPLMGGGMEQAVGKPLVRTGGVSPDAYGEYFPEHPEKLIRLEPNVGTQTAGHEMGHHITYGYPNLRTYTKLLSSLGKEAAENYGPIDPDDPYTYATSLLPKYISKELNVRRAGGERLSDLPREAQAELIGDWFAGVMGNRKPNPFYPSTTKELAAYARWVQDAKTAAIRRQTQREYEKGKYDPSGSLWQILGYLGLIGRKDLWPDE